MGGRGSVGAEGALRCREASGRGTRAPSSSTTLPGGRPGTTETMKEADNRSATASPRGGVESSVVGTRSTAMKVNTIRRQPWTSLRVRGEVATTESSVVGTHGSRHGGLCVASCVVGGSRSGRGCACKGGRSAGRDRSKERPGEFRAIIGAEKRGNARGAKGGRKAERRTNRQGHDIRNRLLLGARTPKTTTVCPGGEYLSAEAIGNHRWPGVESWTPTVELSVLLREANCRLESRVREIRSHGSEGGAA